MCVTRCRPADTMTAMPLTAGGPRDPSTLEPVPHGRTARRLDWLLLPPMTRRLVEDLFGTKVVDAVSSDAGFTPGCASVLTGADGRHDLPQGGQQEGAAAVRRRLPRGDPQAAQPALGAAGPAAAVEPRGRPVGAARPRARRRRTTPSGPGGATSSTRCLDTLELLAQTLTPAADAARARSPRSSPTSSTAGTTSGRRPRTGRTSTRPPPSPRGYADRHGRQHAGAHRRPRRQPPAHRAAGPTCATGTGRSSGAAWIDTVCLLMTGVRRRPRRRRAARRAPADPHRGPRRRRQPARAVLRLLPGSAATSRRRTPRRTCGVHQDW